MTPRTRTRRGGALPFVVPAAVLAVVGLGACSSVGDPSAAAILDGETLVSQAEVATVVEELPLELTGGARVDPAQVLTFLAFAPTVRDIASSEGAVLGEAEAREYLAGIDEQAGRGTGSYSSPTLELISTNLMLTELGQSPDTAPLVQERFEELAERIEVNPRYGEVSDDGQQLLVPARHPWLVSSGA